MRFLFSLSLFVFSLLFTGYGLYTLTVVSNSGKLGPGFFPMIIGLLLVLTTAINCLSEHRRQKLEETTLSEYWRDSFVVAALITLFLLLLPILGSLLTIFIFGCLYLHRFNRGHLIFNTLYSAIFAISVFVLFEVILQAGLPKGLLAPLY